jgi:hypothetical protein
MSGWMDDVGSEEWNAVCGIEGLVGGNGVGIWYLVL